MYEIAKFFLEFAKELVGLGSSLRKATLEKRTRLAEWLENISTCLKEIGNEFGAAFKNEEEPHKLDELCGQLQEFERALPRVCAGLLGKTEIEHFQALLGQRAHARALAAISHDKDLRKREAALMAQAAGELKALASSLKV